MVVRLRIGIVRTGRNAIQLQQKQNDFCAQHRIFQPLGCPQRNSNPPINGRSLNNQTTFTTTNAIASNIHN